MKLAFITALDEYIPEAEKINADVYINAPVSTENPNLKENHKSISLFNASNLKEYDGIIICDFISIFLQLPLIDYKNNKTKIYLLVRDKCIRDEYYKLHLDRTGGNLLYNLLDKIDGIFCNDISVYLNLTEKVYPRLKSSRTRNGNILVQPVYPYYDTFADAIVARVKSDTYHLHRVIPLTGYFPERVNPIDSKSPLKNRIKSFIINLEKRPERYEKMLQSLKNIEIIDPERFNAMTPNFGSEVSVNPEDSAALKELKHITRYTTEYQKIKGNPYNNIYKTLNEWPGGALGCMRSHYELWKQILTTPLKEGDTDRTPFIIFEDDCTPVSDFNFKFQLVINYLNQDNKWNVCHLGTHDDISLGVNIQNHFEPRIDETIKDFGNGLSIQMWNPTTRRTHGGGTFSYIINREGAYNLLECVHKFGICQPIDWFMIEMMSQMTMYKVGPMHLFISPYFNSKSDIQ